MDPKIVLPNINPSLNNEKIPSCPDKDKQTTNKPCLTDEKLYELCKQYGAAARFWRQRFIGLLPEVNRRRLYEKKGFSSIFEFSAKLCGLSAEQVRLTLNLEKRFENKPILKNMLENGEISINKLTRIVSIATSENEEELAEKIKILPVSALNTLVRDIKKVKASLSKPLFGGKSLYVQTFTDRQAPDQTTRPVSRPGAPLNFELSDDIKTELNELHSKGLDVNELLRKLLKQRKQEIAETIQREVKRFNPERTVSRYIPVKIKQILHEEYGQKCSIATCQKPARTIHHTQRFSLCQNHDPRFLAPLCHEHHIIAHSIDCKYQTRMGECQANT